MIDLHCHILPGLDDGAADIAVALEMARVAAGQGIEVVACTPHILPGLYDNAGADIRQATERLQQTLDEQGIPLRLVAGADVHMRPDFVGGLRSGGLLSLAGSRYVLVEPPHHAMPPHLEDFFFKLVVAGYVPVLTHPERLSWVPSHYRVIKRLVRSGSWMQVTAGSFSGAFGRNALYWAERMLDEGFVHLIATDAHDAGRRPPDLARGREYVARRVGAEEAERLVLTRPTGVLDDRPPSSLPGPLGVAYGETGTPLEEVEPQDEGNKARGRTRAAADRRGLPVRLWRLFQ